MDETRSAIADWIATAGRRWLSEPNIRGLQVGHKVVEGMTLDALCVRVTVVRKLPVDHPAATVPPYLTIGQRLVPTDVVEAVPAAAGGRCPSGDRRSSAPACAPVPAARRAP